MPGVKLIDCLNRLSLGGTMRDGTAGNLTWKHAFTIGSVIVALVVALFSLCAAGRTAALDEKSVQSGPAWVVDKTTRLSKLTIAEGARVSAPAGHSLTLTVNGVGTAIAPGTYKGDIVLTPTKEFLLKFEQYDPYRIRAAVIVNDGKYIREQSVAAAAGKAAVNDVAATGVSIISKEENFNGLLITGNSSYTISDARIDMTGNGGNDFAGYGAAIMSSGNAKVTLNRVEIKTRGAVRTAVFVGGKSTMFVNDSSIEVFSGTLPANYEFTIAPGKMMEVPYGLGLSGNVRATNLMDEATVYYTNSRIKSHGWGALSSDGGGPTRMFVNKCMIETEGSGYGAYANGDAHDYFSGSTFNVADVGLIIGGNGWGTFTDGTVVNSGKLGVMMHQGSGGSVLKIEKKSKINSRNTAIQIKGRGADVILDDAELNPGNGILIQTMPNDDPIMKTMAAGGPGPGGPPPGGAPPGGAPPPGASGFGGGARGSESGGFRSNVNVIFRNANLNGDVVHAMTEEGDMTVTLQNATLTGAISTGKATPASGKEPTKETYRTVGEVTNTLSPSGTQHGLKLYLDWGSRWVVSKTSYLTSLVIAEGASVAAPGNYTITLIVNGVETPIRAGVYTGKIVLQVRPGA